MSLVDPVFAEVTAAGTPFEIGAENGLRYFVNAPGDLNKLVEMAKRHGPQTFIVDFEGPDGERRFTYDEIFAWRDAVAARLNVQRGDRVAIAMRNRAEWMVAFLAAVKVGAIAAVLNSRVSGDELCAMIDDVEPALVIADADRAASLTASGYTGRLVDLSAPVEDIGPDVGFTPFDAAPEDPCAILFTSGTTGRVKGAVISHRSLITGLMGAQLTGMMVVHNMARDYNIPVSQVIANIPPQSILLVYPLFHISGLGSGFLAPMLSGAKVVIMRRWDAGEAARLIEAEGVTQFSTVPTMLWDLTRHARELGLNLTSLRNIGSGGQALPVNLLEEARAMCPHAVIGVGYGMTETAGAFAQCVGADFLRKRTAAGRVLPLVDVRIMGDDGQERALGDSGEIQVRGAMVMSGYWNRDADNATAFAEGGWLRTGDVGYMDDEGFVFINDRAKDMVISGGENIYCAEIERVIGEIEAVVDCAAFGIPDDRLGEALVAVVVAKDIDGDHVINWVADQLAHYKAPHQVVVTEGELPRNHVGKIDKIKLRANWHELSTVS
jgi:acyl-CoA synthetase (AMP-forming)/AMP-acid ligase II